MNLARLATLPGTLLHEIESAPISHRFELLGSMQYLASHLGICYRTYQLNVGFCLLPVHVLLSAVIVPEIETRPWAPKTTGRTAHASAFEAEELSRRRSAGCCLGRDSRTGTDGLSASSYNVVLSVRHWRWAISCGCICE